MTRSFVVTGGGRGIGRAIPQRLLSDEAGCINGAVLPVGGGRAVLGLDPEAT